MPKITKTLVDNAAVTGPDNWIWDTELKGFGIRVQESGRKTYVVRYRNQQRVQRKHTVARCSDMAPDKARDLARKVFAAVAEGKDPRDEATSARNTRTMTDLKERYMREHAKPFLKPRSIILVEQLWRDHILPKLGKHRIIDISKAHVLELHGSMAHKQATANMVAALLSKALNLAEDWGWRDGGTNPCRRMKKYRIRQRETILNSEQIGELDRALYLMVETRSITQPMADLVRLLLLTGCRLNEIMSSEQAWVDRERRLLLLPDSKVGQRRIPLSEAAMEIIESIPEGKWLIPGEPGEHMLYPHWAWSKIKKQAKLPTDMRIHDLRHTAGSLAHMAGLTQRQVATMLGHRQLSTTERYLHGHTTDHARAVDTVAIAITRNWVHPAPEMAQ